MSTSSFAAVCRVASRQDPAQHRPRPRRTPSVLTPAYRVIWRRPVLIIAVTTTPRHRPTPEQAMTRLHCSWSRARLRPRIQHLLPTGGQVRHFDVKWTGGGLVEHQRCTSCSWQGCPTNGPHPLDSLPPRRFAHHMASFIAALTGLQQRNWCVPRKTELRLAAINWARRTRR